MSRWFHKGLLFGLVAGLATAPAPGRAEVYMWTDASGQVHMTDDPSQVPAAHRKQAAATGSEASSADLAAPQDQVAMPLRAARAGGSTALLRTETQSQGGRHVLEVESVGSEMRVVAVVDGVEVPFILDTGASGCALPAWAVQQMDVRIDEDTPRVPVVGISGQAMLVPEIRVDSVRVGDAEVEDLHMTVLDTMEVGLLGMPFFNHFRVSTDPVAGVVILEEIDLEALGHVAGGLSERAWRRKFQQRRQALEAVRARLESVPDEYVTIRERLEDKERYWEAQLEALDLEATRLNVPYAWRE